MLRSGLLVGSALAICVLATRADAEISVAPDAISTAADAGAPDPTCIRVWPEARMRAYGYDLIIHVQNTCTKDALCAVSSDVNPEVSNVKVPKAAEVETVAWLGSPAREFTPRVKCQLQ
jgi:hypothetical protein